MVFRHWDHSEGHTIRWVDGSATLAMNPIALYLVVSNNTSGPDDQTRMVALPQVSRVKGVRFDDKHARVVVDALVDSTNENGTKIIQKPATVVATAIIKQDRLADRIELAVSQIGN